MIKTYCDKCGRLEEEQEDFIITEIHSVYSNHTDERACYDLCTDCHDGFLELLEVNLRENNDG